MNKVIIINLNGNAYQLEENGYEALRAYLDSAGRRLEANPDRDEIVADIEQAIADKFRAVLGANKTVVAAKEVEGVIAEMGPVEDASAPSGAAQADGRGAPAPGAHADPATGASAGAPKRLYKIADGAMIGGVCNGVAAYFNIDVTIVRILFAILAFTYGAGVLLYLLMMFILPSANTSAERAAAGGTPPTAQEFIRRAKAGYYEGMKAFGDRQTRREWKRKFKQDMRGWKRDFRREMHRGANQFHENWHQYWAQRGYPAAGAWIAIPILVMLSVLITLMGLACVISLLSTGAVFGMSLPAGIPVWAGVIFLIIAFRMATWPLREMRHSLYFGGGPYYAGSFVHFWNSIFWIGLLLLLIWYAKHHSSDVHEALGQIRPQLRHAVDSVKQWLDK
jgi:phage shock protein PspC (stress-responsive transcriptional regulator)